MFDPRHFTLERHPFYLFNHIFLQRGRELNRILVKHNVDYPQWRVLAVLRDWPDCTMQTLSEKAGVDRTTLTHTVRLLIDAGLIKKATRSTDRRSVVLSLTEQGMETAKDVLPEILAVSEKCFAGFTDEEIEQFMATLMRIISNMRDGSMAPALFGESEGAIAIKARS